MFYVDLVNTLTAVPVQTSGATFATANPAKLFETAYAAALTSSRDYDVAPNGQRFLMIKENVARDRSAPVGMVVVQNWFEGEGAGREVKRPLKTGTEPGIDIFFLESGSLQR